MKSKLPFNFAASSFVTGDLRQGALSAAARSALAAAFRASAKGIEPNSSASVPCGKEYQ
jgi:glutamate synthase domain-containing protein 2